MSLAFLLGCLEDCWLKHQWNERLRMPSTPFGDHLKREREMRGVTLEEIAAATRISPRFLEALENERWEQLPGGAFNRGFIRSVARFLGLDEESMVAEYALETKGLNQAAGNDGQGMPRDWRPAIVAAIAVVALILLMAFAFHYYRARARARAAIEQQMEAAPAPKTPIAPPLNAPTTPAAPSSPGGSH